MRARKTGTAVVAAACACVAVCGALERSAYADNPKAIRGGVLRSEEGEPEAPAKASAEAPERPLTRKEERWQSGKRLMIAGGSVLGGGFLISALFAGFSSLGQSFCGLGVGKCGGHREYGYAIVPLVGPFITMHTARDGVSPAGAVGLAVLGGIQNAGVAMMMVGQHYRSDKPETSLLVAPTFTAGGGGLSVTGTF